MSSELVVSLEMGVNVSPQITLHHSNTHINNISKTRYHFFKIFFMDFILEENAHGLALKFSQNHGNLENYKHGTVK